MKNVDLKVEKNVLVIRVDLGKNFGPSKSGKTIIVASSEGNEKVPGHEDMKIGLNVYQERVAGA